MMEHSGEETAARVVRYTAEERICICRMCGGTGTVDGSRCSRCSGSGRVRVMTDVTNYIRPYVPEN